MLPYEEAKKILVSQNGPRRFAGDSYPALWAKIAENDGVTNLGGGATRYCLQITLRKWLDFLGGTSSPYDSIHSLLRKILIAKGGSAGQLVSHAQLIYKLRLAMSNVYDPAALDYFTRAEALGGSFDQSAINATYTEAYVKTAISNCVAGLKSDGVWDSITELYLLSGVSFGGLMAKLKYASVPTLTNNNFVAGDYIAVGAGAGLKGDGSTKYLDTLYPQTSVDDLSLSAYQTERPTEDAFKALIASVVSSGNRGFGIFSCVNAGTYRGNGGHLQYFNNISVQSYNTVGHFLSTINSFSGKPFFNGVVTVPNISIINSISNGSYAIFRASSNRAADYHAGRIAAAHIGTGLTDAQVLAFYNRTQTLATSLGFAV